MTQYISFPKLFDHIFEINNVAFSIGSWEIKWYGIILATAFLCAAIYAMQRAKQFGTNADTLVDFLLFALPLCIVGSRIYYVANTWGYYKDHLSEIVQIWNGGLAMYGSVIVGLIVVYFFGKYNKRRFDAISFLDLGGVALLLGQSLGRWGNFVNGEAFGTATTLPFGMVISDTMTSVGTAVHPTFFYEAAWTMAGFIILHFYSKRRKFKGEIFALYCAWYGLGRGFIEGLRTDSLYIGSTDVRISQALSFILLGGALIFLVYMYATKKYKSSRLFSIELAPVGVLQADAEHGSDIAPSAENSALETDAPEAEENPEK